MKIDPTEFVWTQKYRPQTVEDTILPDAIKNMARGVVKGGRVPGMILSGGAGCGKTTLAFAICNELQADVMFINASSEGGIDTIRTKMTQFASTSSFSDAKKVTILDEADGLSPSAQQALRSFAEEFSANHSLILTCNFKNKLIEPLRSRGTCDIDFVFPKAEKPQLMSEMFKRICEILDLEKITYNKKVVAELVQTFFPDFRKTLNEIQKYSIGGTIDAGILTGVSEENVKELCDLIKGKKYSDCRKWVAEHEDMEYSTLFRRLYNVCTELLEPKSIPEMVLIIAQYQYWASHVADQQINTMAAITELMSRCDWKS